MLRDIIDLQFRQFSEDDFANPHELNIVNTHINEVKSYFSLYNFDSVYSLENFADYCLVSKIANWNFKSYLSVEYKAIFDVIQQYFKDIKSKFSEKNIAQFLNNYDFSMTDDFGYDFCYSIYSILPKFYKSLAEESYKRAIIKQPYLVLDFYDEYKSVFKRFPSLYSTLFSVDNLELFLEHRMESLVKIGANICNNTNFPSSDVKIEIQSAFDKLGQKILSNTDIELALRYQIIYKSVLKFFKTISSPKYNYYYERQHIVDELESKWLDEKGQTFSYEIPFSEIKKQFDNPTIPWYLKQIMLTHSRNSDQGDVEHYCVHAMRTGKNSLTELVSTNMDTNAHFGMMTQQLLGIYHNIYCNALNYYVSNLEKWENFYNNTVNILLYVFKIVDSDISQINRQLRTLKNKGKEYLFNKKLNDEEKQDLAIEFTQINIKLIERLLRIIYISEKKEANSFYNPDKITLGILLDYYDKNNPLIKILSVELMQYLSYCLIKDKDEKGREVGMNLRNSIAHDNFDHEKFSYSNGIFSLLLLTSAINALFLYYNKVNVELNKGKIEQEQKQQEAIKMQNDKISFLKKATEKGIELSKQLHEQFKKIPGVEKIGDNHDVEELRKQLQNLVNREVKDSEEFKRYLEILNESDKNELEVCLRFIDYYIFLDATRKNLFSSKYSQSIEKLEDQGLFFCMMSTPDIPEEILFSENNVKVIGQLYSLKLRDIFKNILSADGQLAKCYDAAIGFFEDGNYKSCALTLMRNINGYIEELRKTILSYNSFEKINAFDYYEASAKKILSYYARINLPLEQWDAKSLNYDDMQKDNPAYNVTDLDCVRLFLLMSATCELASLFQALDWLISKPNGMLYIKKILAIYKC